MREKKAPFKKALSGITLWILGIIAFGALSNEELEAREYLLKAKVIHSISYFISWPEEHPSNDFHLCVLGENEELYQALILFFKQKPILNNKPLTVRKTDLQAAESCRVLFIPTISESQLNKTIDQLASKPILLFSDSEGYAERGTHINLYVENNKVRFEVNREASKKAGIGLSSQLLRLAKIVKAKES